MGLQMSQKTTTTPKRLCGAEVGIDQMSSSIAITTGLETRLSLGLPEGQAGWEASPFQHQGACLFT